MARRRLRRLQLRLDADRPFPAGRVEFFDHTPQPDPATSAVEMGMPLPCDRRARADGLRALAGVAQRRSPTGASRRRRIRSSARPSSWWCWSATHSLLEYPLWYAYFLLPDGVRVRPLPRSGRPRATGRRSPPPRRSAASPVRWSSRRCSLILGGTLAVYDYMRVVIIFAPAGQRRVRSSKRIAAGRRSSVLFGHHADYAAATVAEHPGPGDGGVPSGRPTTCSTRA